MQHGGHAWYAVRTPGAPDRVDVDTAAAHVDQWLQQNIAPERPVILLGFSQGGVIELQMLRRNSARYSAIVVLSGFLAPHGHERDDALAAVAPSQRVSVFYGRDPQDPIVGGEAVARTVAWLPKHTKLTEKHYPGTRHSISGEEMKDVHAFIKEALAQRAATPGAARK